MQNAIIVGAGTYGQVYLQYLKEHYNIIGFIDDNEDLKGSLVEGIPVLGDSQYLFTEVCKTTSIFVPIGNNPVRVRILNRLQEEGFITPCFIHIDTIIHESVKIGQAVYILPGTNIMPFTTLGDYVMVSMGVNIAHHTTIEKGCFFSQGSNIGASIHIETHAYFGIASTAMTGVTKIGENTLVGAGAVIIKNTPVNAVVAGIPAKILRYQENLS